MVWDGECGFCKYWVTHWKSKTNNRIDYRTYQDVSSNFADIPISEFKKASRLIETNGAVFSGPDSAFRSFTYFKNPVPVWHNWYSKYQWFTSLCDYGYNFIANHRSFMFKLTKLFFGKDPKALKPYWLTSVLLMVMVIYLSVKYL